MPGAEEQQTAAGAPGSEAAGAAASEAAGSPIEAVLFDIDGTLISSGGASTRAWRRAFQELYGIEVNVWDHSGPGTPDPEVGRLSFRGALGREPSKRELTRVMNLRLKLLPEEVERSTEYRVMPGVEALLERLIEAGLLLGLTTGNVEAAAHIKLSRANLNRFFSFGGYGSDSPDRAELTRKAVERAAVVSGGAVSPAECIATGDTPHDVEAGHRAGIRVLGVATGRYEVGQLREAGADWAVADFTADLPV